MCMKTTWIRPLLIVALLACVPCLIGAQPTPRIHVVVQDVAPRVDVVVHGRPFTSYVFLHSLPRPSLDPIRSAGGAVVTRKGFWFAHANVNGVDFVADNRPQGDGRGGRILHRRVIEATSSDVEGQLAVEMTWVGPDQALAMVEDTRFVFRARDGVRSIDRLTRLNAVRGPVRLLRNARGLAGVGLGFLTRRSVIIAPQGSIGRAAIGGVRRPWLAVSGSVGSRPVTVALLDHPHNPGFPNAWRLDDSGSFEITPTSDVGIDADRSVSFRHRLVVFSGRVDPSAIEREFHDFSAQGGVR